MKYATQIEKLKEAGLYGTTGDPYWDRKKKMHTCCGSTRSYYHRSGCPACTGGMIKIKKETFNKEMQWSNLQKNKCPQCNKDLVKSMVPVGIGMIGCNCGFKIGEQKYKEIIADRLGKEYGNDETNPEETSGEDGERSFLS